VAFDLTHPLRLRQAALANVAIVVLGFASPVAVFVAFRLLMKTCTGINFLGLPWPAPVEVIVAVIAILIALAWFPSIAWGFLRAELRIAAIVSTCTAFVSVGPVLIAMFLSIYGDPGLDCAPI
jgi:uncharacterized membrane protein (UPF0182 family)